MPRPLVKLVVLGTALCAFVAGAASGGAAPLASPTPQPPRPPTPTSTAPPALAPAAVDAPELRAVWVDAFHDGFKTPEQVDQLVAWARRANLNALFVQVRRRGDAYYSRSFEPRSDDPALAPGFDALQYLLDRAHQGPQRLQVHAWLATLPAWHKRDAPPEDPAHVFNQHGPDDGQGTTWLSLRDDGEAWAGSGGSGSYYLDPGHPDAARYTADVYLNVLRNYDVDGIHLDQVRYFEGDAGHWGYNPTSVARFNQHAGRDPSSQPDPDDPEWAAWRRDQVTALVRRVYLEAKALKPSVAVSAAVVAWGRGPEGESGWQQSSPYARVFQDWLEWLQEGIVDYVLPMDYYRESGPQAGWFDNWTRWQRSNQGKRGVVIGIGGYLNSPDATLAQLQRARALGPLGLALYSYASPSSDAADGSADARESFAGRLGELFTRPAPIPDLPWLPASTSGGVLVEVAGREDAPVTLSGPGGGAWQTDGTGLAGAPEVPAGTYSLRVVAPGVDPQPVAVWIEPGRTAAVRFAVGATSP